MVKKETKKVETKEEEKELTLHDVAIAMYESIVKHSLDWTRTNLCEVNKFTEQLQELGLVDDEGKVIV